VTHGIAKAGRMYSSWSATFLMVVLCILVPSIEAGLMFLELNETSPLEYSLQMNNQHIAMMGDSLMGYQFLSLAYLLHKKTFVPSEVRPNILIKNSFDSLDEFRMHFKKVLAPRSYQDFGKDHANHFYFDKERNISITVINYAGFFHTPRGGWVPTELDGFPVEGKSPKFTSTRWNYPTLEETIAKFLSKLNPRPTTLILNAGHWENDWNDTARQNAVLTSAQQQFDRVFWKTTNYNHEHQPGDYAHDSVCHYPGIECLNLDWTKYLDPVHYTDRVHFMPEVYHDINAQFIYQLTKRKSLHIAPLSAAHYGQIVIYKTKHFLVGPVGLLRPFSLPADTEENSVCRKEIAARKHVHMPWGRLINHILGEPLPEGICGALKLVHP